MYPSIYLSIEAKAAEAVLLLKERDQELAVARREGMLLRLSVKNHIHSFTVDWCLLGLHHPTSASVYFVGRAAAVFRSNVNSFSPHTLKERDLELAAVRREGMILGLSVAILSPTQCFQSRFVKVNAHTYLSTYSL